MIKPRYDLKTDVDKLILKAIDSAKTMRLKVQIAAIAVLHHAFKHGDYTKANDLVNGLGDGVHSAALVEFFVVYGGLIVNEDEQCFDAWQGKGYIKDNFDNAKATMWWELKKVNPWAGYDMYKQLEKLVSAYDKAVARVAKMSTEGEDTTDLLNADKDVMRVLSGLSKGISIEAAVAPYIEANFEEADTTGAILQEMEALENDIANAA